MTYEIGTNGDDQIDLGDGNHFVVSGDGNDTITTGDGFDIVFSCGGNNSIDIGDGGGIVVTGNGDDSITGGNGNHLIYSGGGNDTITTGDGFDMVFGYGGDKQIDVGDGGSWIVTGDGNDNITAGDGCNYIFSGSGNDTIETGDGFAYIVAYGGDKQIDVGNGNAIIVTGDGNDVITGGDGNHYIYSGAGDDTITMGNGFDYVFSGAGNDVIDVGDGGSYIVAGSGDDTITVGAGTDIVRSGGGNDTVIYRSSGLGAANSWDALLGQDGTDTLVLDLSLGEYKSAAVQSDIAAYLDHVAATPSETYYFSSLNLYVRSFETFKVTVDGTELSPVDEGVTAANDSALLQLADGPTVFGSVLDNDSVPNGVASISVVTGPAMGSVIFNTDASGQFDGTYTFDPTGAFDDLPFGASTEVNFTYRVTDLDGDSAEATVTVTVAAPQRPPEVNVGLFEPSDTPSVLSNDDPNAVELGVKFSAASAGMISGIRYYKSANDTGTHTGSLWTSTGTLLATATFTNETASGWQEVSFSSPVQISAGVTYIASYHSNGFYASTPDFFETGYTNGLLSAGASGDTGGNGVFAYGPGGFPTQSFNENNYWVDVVYTEIQGNLDPVANNDGTFGILKDGALTVAAAALTANDTDPNADGVTITGVGSAINGTVSFDANTQTVTFTADAGFLGNASFDYTISDGNGGTDTATVHVEVAETVSLFNSFDTPDIVSADDPNPVNIGMRFSTDVSGTVEGIRFYKGPDNVGPHTGYLWTATGTLLASQAFTNETASGWQETTLSAPVAITAGTEYVVSYHTNGNYSASQGFFTDAYSNNGITAPASTATAGNGPFAYGEAGLFPSAEFQESNYFVDIVFRPTVAA